ncbi:unnamed protein product [Nippostrongylus brasiliensis]|uniref:Uncharacterized protein n=1 Tax=Nippostrongylus brasiliensis TaxID=27835 RepID=A0A0N4YSN3_NIPBR|nr:unnamed protein product [Nippostrongylus brasiliensis]
MGYRSNPARARHNQSMVKRDVQKYMKNEVFQLENIERESMTCGHVRLSMNLGMMESKCRFKVEARSLRLLYIETTRSNVGTNFAKVEDLMNRNPSSTEKLEQVHVRRQRD